MVTEADPRGSGPKGVKAQIQGDELRVSSSPPAEGHCPAQGPARSCRTQFKLPAITFTLSQGPLTWCAGRLRVALLLLPIYVPRIQIGMPVPKPEETVTTGQRASLNVIDDLYFRRAMRWSTGGARRRQDSPPRKAFASIWR